MIFGFGCGWCSLSSPLSLLTCNRWTRKSNQPAILSNIFLFLHWEGKQKHRILPEVLVVLVHFRYMLDWTAISKGGAFLNRMTDDQAFGFFSLPQLLQPSNGWSLPTWGFEATRRRNFQRHQASPFGSQLAAAWRSCGERTAQKVPKPHVLMSLCRVIRARGVSTEGVKKSRVRRAEDVFLLFFFSRLAFTKAPLFFSGFCEISWTYD